MTLFADDRDAAPARRQKFFPVRTAPVVTPSVFAAWAPHLRTEFVLLALEAGKTLRVLRDETGVSMRQLELVAEQRHAHALDYESFAVLPEDAPFQPHQTQAKGRKAKTMREGGR